jgi:Lrp/AsnC family transcriptional regulator for asnA, asnC and gidA
MNPLDRKIIDALTQDARTSFRSIAAETDKSTDTVINHYRQLTEDGTIRGSTVVLDPQHLGYEGTAAFHIDVTTTSGHTPAQVLETLIGMPNIIVATKTVGEHDLLALAVIHSIRHYAELGREIAAIPGVRNISSNVWAGNQEICPKYFII